MAVRPVVTRSPWISLRNCRHSPRFAQGKSRLPYAQGAGTMEKARLFVLYGSFDTAMAALRDLNAAEIGADAVTLLSPHAAGRHGSATVAATTATDIPPDRTSGQNVPSAQVV